MRRLASVALLPAVCFAANPLDISHLEAIHGQRVEWMKKRVVIPPQGIYRDVRAAIVEGSPENALKAAKDAGIQVLFSTEAQDAHWRNGILIAPAQAALPHFDADPPARAEIKNQRRLRARFKQYPDEVLDLAGPEGLPDPQSALLRHSIVHVLAREVSEVPQSLGQHRAYLAHDWLCDPAGFYFIAENSFGAYDIGDNAPLLPGTKVSVSLPIPGSIRILHNEKSVLEKNGSRLQYAVTEPGSYRAEVSLTIAGEQRLWIQTQAIRFSKPNFAMPVAEPSPNVEIHKDIAYIDDGQPKHRLDVFLPKGGGNFPVMIFFHGGSWRTGDRSMYAPIGDRFARAGIAVVIPSYRLIPRNPYPAQIEDAAAAFAWVYRNIGQFGGDVSRIYVAGHSAGGHLASLLALDPEWLKRFGISPNAIRGVASLSGVYEVDQLAQFKDLHASPIDYAHPRMPPFLISYCQWDYFGLPKQARDFSMALKKEFGEVNLIYVPGESHISEALALLRDGDPLAKAIVEFVR